MADLMIGIMKGTLDSTDLGALKSASLTLKPQYKEHKSGFPQITDIKVPEVVTGTFKFDCEEVKTAGPILKSAARALGSGVPTPTTVHAVAPTAQGGGFTMTGSGYFKGGSVQMNSGDFGAVSLEIDCVPMGTGTDPLITFGHIAAVGSSTIAQPSYANQSITKDKNNLAFGTPTCEGSNCKSVAFNATSNFKYHTVGYPPVIDLAIMETNNFEITAEFEDPAALLLTDALASLTPGGQPVIKPVTIVLPLIDMSTFSIQLINAMIEPDLTFNPGNDWNGVSVKCTALLPAGTLPSASAFIAA
jgi:hypothetical protein